MLGGISYLMLVLCVFDVRTDLLTLFICLVIKLLILSLWCRILWPKLQHQRSHKQVGPPQTKDTILTLLTVLYMHLRLPIQDMLEAMVQFMVQTMGINDEAVELKLPLLKCRMLGTDLM